MPRTPRSKRPALGPAGPARDSRRQYLAIGLGFAGLLAAGVLIGGFQDTEPLAPATPMAATPAAATADADAPATPDG